MERKGRPRLADEKTTVIAMEKRGLAQRRGSVGQRQKSNANKKEARKQFECAWEKLTRLGTQKRKNLHPGS